MVNRVALPNAARCPSTPGSGYESRSVSAFRLRKSNVILYDGFSGVQSALRIRRGCALYGLRHVWMSPAFSCFSTASLSAAFSSLDRGLFGAAGGNALPSSMSLVLMLILYACA